MASNLFRGLGHSQLYKTFRPVYPNAVYETIASYCKSGLEPGMNLAVDVGCGSGQSSLPLANYFQEVVGIDVSETQIDQAPDVPGVCFRVGQAESLDFLKDNSVDLVTIAQAMHWVNTEKFYTEVNRVLKPGGSLVAYGYTIPEVDQPEAKDVIEQFFKKTLEQYWEPGRQHIHESFRKFSLPFPGWVRNDNLHMDKFWTVDEFTGYLSTASAWQSLKKVHPESDELHNIHERLQSLLFSGGEERVVFRWPIFMLMGKKPHCNN
ncbi:hypothetical protein ScPMuIL_016229 [Solemya velum]